MKDKSARGEQPLGKVLRAYPIQLEVRSDKKNGTANLEGYASATDKPYTMYDMFGEYSETVRSGAFAKTLSENPATQLLLNHGGLSMAYTKAGSLRLAEDSTGLHMSADVNTSRGDVRDMVTAIKDGNIDEMSFAFRITRQKWAPDFDACELQEVDIHRGDVSVVNFGANPAASVAMRAQWIDGMDEAEVRTLIERLKSRFPEPTATYSLSLYSALAESL